MKNISKEQLFTAYQNLPRPVRTYLAGQEPYDLVQTLGNKYRLHIDVTGVISYLITYMLCGLISPTQFRTSLHELDIPDENANAIIQELNEKVFRPLNEKVKNAPPEETAEEDGGEPAQTPQSIAPTPTLKKASPPPNLPGAMPQMAPERALPIPPAGMSLPPTAPPPRPAPLPPRPVPPTLTPTPAQPPAATSTSAPPSPSKPILKDYGIDPYRELPE